VNSEANSVRKKYSSATIIVDVKRFAHQINTEEVFDTYSSILAELDNEVGWLRSAVL
jgi:hypothetical protein